MYQRLLSFIAPKTLLEQAAQVYGVLSVPCSVSVIVAALIFSPILAASLWCGSILGCLAGIKVITKYL